MVQHTDCAYAGTISTIKLLWLIARPGHAIVDPRGRKKLKPPSIPPEFVVRLPLLTF